MEWNPLDQAQFLRENACPTYANFLMAKPVSLDEQIKYLTTGVKQNLCYKSDNEIPVNSEERCFNDVIK